jgi:signal transduction histidine kinase
MRYLVVLCLYFASLMHGSAQRIQELLAQLQSAETDSLKIVAYHDLANHFRYSNLDSTIFYAREGMAYAQETKYALGEAMMINVLAQANERHGFLDVANAQYAQAQAIFKRIQYKKGIATTSNGLGVVAGRTGQYDEATRHFLDALQLFEGIGDTRGIVQTYIKLGVVSDLLGDLDKALEYYLKAEQLNAEPSSPNASLTLLNNIGIIYGKRNDIGRALKYFHKGLRESDPKKSTGVHIALLGSLGIAYEKAGRHDSALYFQQQALSMARKSNLPEEEARALVNLSSLVNKSDADKSLALLREALAITERIQQLNLMTEVYEAMIQLHKQEDNYREALHLSEKRQLLKDSLFSLQKSKEIANLHANYELAKQENEIRGLALSNEKSMMQRNIMVVIALVCMTMILIVWYFNTKVSNLNGQLISKQTELKNSNTVKDKLFSILGHDLRAPLSRVIGLLNVLALDQQTRDKSQLIEKLRQQSLNTLETLDNLLLWGQRQLKGIRLNQQTIQVKEQISKTVYLTGDYAAQKDVKLVDHTPSDILVHADPSHFDFVVRNLLSNAVKFSHSGGTIVINAFASADKEVVLSIRDSGVGIPKDLQKGLFNSGNESMRGTWNEKGTGIGLMLCREYITENGGRLWVESEPGKGSTFYFSLLRKQIFPKPELEATEA